MMPLTQSREGPGGEDPRGWPGAASKPRCALGGSRGSMQGALRCPPDAAPRVPPPLPAPAVLHPCLRCPPAPSSLHFPSSTCRFQRGPAEGTLLLASGGFEGRVYTCTLTHAHTQALQPTHPSSLGPHPSSASPRGEPGGAGPSCGETPLAAGSQASPASLSHALLLLQLPCSCSGEGALEPRVPSRGAPPGIPVSSRGRPGLHGEGSLPSITTPVLCWPKSCCL